MQRPEMTVLRDTNEDDVADEYDTALRSLWHLGQLSRVCLWAGSQWRGRLFWHVEPGLQSTALGSAVSRLRDQDRPRTAASSPWAFGLRSPNGVAFDPAGRLFYTDNQGEYIPVCKLQEARQGEFYGHKASLPWMPGVPEGETPEVIQPAVWFPLAIALDGRAGLGYDGRAFRPLRRPMPGGGNDQFADPALRARGSERARGKAPASASAAVFSRESIGWPLHRMGRSSSARPTAVGDRSAGKRTACSAVLYTGNVPVRDFVDERHVRGLGSEIHAARSTNRKPPIPRTGSSSRTRTITGTHTARRKSNAARIKSRRCTRPEDGLSVRLIVPERDLRRVYHLQLKDIGR